MRNRTWLEIAEGGALAVVYLGILVFLLYPVLEAGGYFAA